MIEESDGLTVNQMFHSANVYLGNKLSSSTRRIKVQKQEKEKSLDVSLDRNQELVDRFNGAKMKWVMVSSRVQKPVPALHSEKGKGNSGREKDLEASYR